MQNLQKNKEIFASQEDLFNICERACTEWGQSHLFQDWEEPGTNDELKISFAKQLILLDQQYPGGIITYINNAKKLLQDSKNGVNPFEGFVPTIPHGEKLSIFESGDLGKNLEQFDYFEEKGMEVVPETCFVVVAGGLGERLGYSGIKLGLATNILTNECYLKLYCDHILALQAAAKKKFNLKKNVQMPFAIMTSGDTHERTIKLLEDNKNFGLAKDQITIVKQEKVPALLDNEAHFALDGPYEVMTKPHGHGDVHSLLFTSGLVKKWVDEGKQYLCFLQDTNGLMFRALPSALGVSAEKHFDVNSLSVPRKPGEAVGAICKLIKKESDLKEVDLTINVEYNQLDPLLKATVNPLGDVPTEAGLSKFPGNINVLIFKLPPYLKVLERTQGGVPEFVNPKYADATKTKFKAPTRLECMMQEYPRLLVGDESSGPVGFTQLERFLSYSAVKSNLADAKINLEKTGFATSASSGESDFYNFGRKILSIAGCKINADEEKIEKKLFGGVQTIMGAKVLLKPSFGCTLKDIRNHFVTPNDVEISDRSALILEGDVDIKKLKLDGFLHVKAGSGAKITIANLTVENTGVEFDPIEDGENVPEVLAIRGYKLKGDLKDKVISCEKGEKVVDDAHATAKCGCLGK